MDNSTSTNTQDGSFDSVNAVVFPIFAALSIFIIYIPMNDFFRKRNFAMCSMITAVTLMNFYCLVNAAIWHNDDFNTWWTGEGLCDIEVNTRYMMSVALATSMACFTKNLADVFNPDSYSFVQTTSMKRRKLAIDILFCWGVPVLQIALHYVASTGRYDISPVWGCADNFDSSWPFVVFYLLPFPVFSLLSGYYAVLMLIGLLKHRSNISSTLASSGSGMSTRYFLKLAIIACSLLVIWLPGQAYWISRQWPVDFHSYNWDSIHDPVGWGPIVFDHNSENPFLQYNGWTSVVLSFVIFVYFGFNGDAVDKYRKWLVNCGLGKVFPSLKGPRQRRRQGSTTRSSLSSHFDLVSKAMHYFDNSRKNSCVPSSLEPASAQSRKGSQAPFEISLAQVNSNKNTATPD
ncbi:Pheromone a factor receptor, partial [Lachnellula suecica]